MNLIPSHADKSNSQTESGDEFSTPPRGSKAARQAWAIRRYHGIGPDGRLMEEWTGQEVADALGVSPRTVRRWCNEESLPLVDEWSQRARWTIYYIALSGDPELVEEYLLLRELEEKSESRNMDGKEGRISSKESVEPESNPHPFPESVW